MDYLELPSAGPKVGGVVGLILNFFIIPMYIFLYVYGFFVGPWIFISNPFNMLSYIEDPSIWELNNQQALDVADTYAFLNILRFNWSVSPYQEITLWTFIDTQLLIT